MAWRELSIQFMLEKESLALLLIEGGIASKIVCLEKRLCKFRVAGM